MFSLGCPATQSHWTASIPIRQRWLCCGAELQNIEWSQFGTLSCNRGGPLHSYTVQNIYKQYIQKFSWGNWTCWLALAFIFIGLTQKLPSLLTRPSSVPEVAVLHLYCQSPSWRISLKLLIVSRIGSYQFLIPLKQKLVLNNSNNYLNQIILESYVQWCASNITVVMRTGGEMGLRDCGE